MVGALTRTQALSEVEQREPHDPLQLRARHYPVFFARSLDSVCSLDQSIGRAERAIVILGPLEEETRENTEKALKEICAPPRRGPHFELRWS